VTVLSAGTTTTHTLAVVTQTLLASVSTAKGNRQAIAEDVLAVTREKGNTRQLSVGDTVIVARLMQSKADDQMSDGSLRTTT
jgi:hypothetical protein